MCLKSCKCDTFGKWWAQNSELMFRLKGTVILTIWPQIFLIVFFATSVVSCHKYVPGMAMEFTTTLVPILGLVIGLLLVFRTNTAYDRYYEGRRIWSMMTFNIRVLARCFWLSSDKDNPVDSPKRLIEKMTAINLLVAFAYATKNYLREDYSYDLDSEIQELITHVPKFRTPEVLEPLLSQFQNELAKDHSLRRNSGCGLRSVVTIKIDKDVTKKPNSKIKKIPPNSTKGKYSLAGTEEWKLVSKFNRQDSMYQAHDYVKPTNIPLELTYYIHSYCNLLGIESGQTNVNNLIKCLTQFERILRTPMPLAYSVHLHQSLWLYLLALPFQLVSTLGWVTIPVIALVTFALLGILAIGWEIENPFGLDDNDLPLDNFCEVIRKELQMIVGHEVQKPEVWTHCSENKPFIPRSYESAKELNDKSVAELRLILSKTCHDFE